ncbi:TonB-dependent receptor [Sandaracinobacter sp. RS1-74]|uniref:TonB-dependent receptor domain-containing protein n=1 Tax=Sandaracinobacteroides sayramensis TaxID=2913411 RepID=UPI001EDBA693|nr:TonB-dependent receptor [Sandaracinobacteroides sayramensis]MCG2840339.1 TonB-dependent receptor [Sandaracinobacteroides sayramensis]
MRRHAIPLLLAGACAFAPAALRAQTAAQEAPAAEAPDDGGLIVVTGSRIVRDGYSAPTPVTVATADELVRSTPTNLPDALNKLPQFQNSSSPSRSSHNFANSAGHGNVLNLRGLGGARTLILFDGVRVPPTTYLGTVDTNVIPNLLVERIDIVTGGASAAYGSDAVAGVVNFVLDRDFTGLKGNVQTGISARGDNASHRIGLAGGTSFAGGRGHILASGEYFRSDGMLRSDRDSARQGYTYVGSRPGCVNPNPVADPTACNPGGTLNPYTIASNVRLTAGNEYGKIVSGPFANHRFTETGAIVPFDNGTPTGTAGFAIGGDGYAISPDTQAITPLETWQTFGRASYELSDDISAFVQGGFTRSELSYVSLANSLLPPQGAVLFSGNPYLPAEIESAFTPGSQSITVARYGASSPKPRTSERTDYWQVGAGLEGKLGAWKWDVGYVHGSSTHKVAQEGVWEWQKFYAALDAVRHPDTGAIVCRPTLSDDPAIRARFADCSPLNILSSGSAYAAQPGYAYATGTSQYRARNTSDAVSVNFSGPLFELPAGSVSLAVGAEYRTQKLSLTSNANPALLDTPEKRAEHFAGLRGVSSSALFYWLTNVGEADGKLNVKEGYAEIAVPLLKEVPFFDSLDLNGAIRVTDYSTSGTVTTWKLGATWRPVADLLLRATRSRDIRAPNLFELFAGNQSNISLLVDPVSGLTQNVPQVSGGNPDLKPEVAQTLTLGAVATPGFLPGFSFAADYYDIRIDKAIGTLGLAQIVNNCFTSGGSAPECALITRPSPSEFPTEVRVTPANIAALVSRGIDFDASYRTSLGGGALALRLYASRLLKYETQQSATAPRLDYTGVSVVGANPIGYPKWRGTLNLDYSLGAFGATIAQQYIGSMTLGIPGSPQNFVEPKVGAVWYTDLTLRADVPAAGGNAQLFLTINNLFDKDPPLIPGTTPGVNLPTNFAIYDMVGRTFTAGLRFQF